MAADQLGRGRRAAAILAFYCAVFVATVPAAGELTDCLSPVAEQTVKELFAAGRLQATLGPSLTLTGVSLTGTTIEVRASNAAGQQYGIDLSLPGASARQRDGRGQRFVFHFLSPVDSRGAGAIEALTATANLIDRSVPDTAFADCSGRASPPPGQTVRARVHQPRAHALGSAIVQLLVLVTAAIVGYRAVRSM